MTDKKEFDQEELNVAFERLNQSDGLQPSAELDAMILKMAADEVGASTEEEKTKVTDISDISFRRGQREAHKALKKKGMFPKWVMPMGLAATVLLSFGVVNRVLLSPEFDNLTKQSSYETMSDEVIVSTDLESKVRAQKDASSINKPVQPVATQKKRLQSDNAKAKVTVNGNEMNADISFADAPSQAVSEPPPPALDNVTMPSAVPAEDIRLNNTEIAGLEASVAEIEADIQSDSEKQKLDSRQEQHALLAKEKRERLTQARRSNEPQMQSVPTSGYSVTGTAPAISNAGPSIGNIESVEAELSGSSRLDESISGLESTDAELQLEAAPSVSEMDSVEETIVVTGSRLKNDSDDTTDKASESMQQVLQSVLFEHKQCQLKQDCVLVALECDSCDCLEPVNNEHYNKYQSEFSKSEISEQCINTTVECVRNYCQIQQSE